jgi:hypothetical protein
MHLTIQCALTSAYDGHRLGHAILGDRFFKVTPGCSLVTMGAQHEIDGVAVFVNGAAEIFPVALGVRVLTAPDAPQILSSTAGW